MAIHNRILKRLNGLQKRIEIILNLNVSDKTFKRKNPKALNQELKIVSSLNNNLFMETFQAAKKSAKKNSV